MPRLIVCHIADGSYEGTKAWFLNPASQVSSHYIIGKEGQICQCVSLDQAAWCNGTGSGDRNAAFSTVSLVRTLGGNANQYTVSIEFEGIWNQTKGALTQMQQEAAVWLILHIQKQVQSLYGYTIPLSREGIVGHYEITPRTRPHCPGENFPWEALIAELHAQSDQKDNFYRIQIGAFFKKSNAEAYQKEIASVYGLQTFLAEGITENHQPVWRIQMGAFTDKENADAYLVEIKQQGLDAFIVLPNAETAS